jgi:hypothetical protein
VNWSALSFSLLRSAFAFRFLPSAYNPCFVF